MSHGALPPIHSAKNSERLALAPNRPIKDRLVAQLLSDMAHGDVRAAPPIRTLSEWVEDTAVRLRQLEGREVPRSQDGAAEHLAWMRIFEKEGAGHGHALGAARQARAANRFLRQWLLDDESTWLDSRFYRLRQSMQRQRGEHLGFHAEDWMADLVARLAEEAPLPVELPREISLHGFVEFTAAERRLLDGLEGRGVRLAESLPQNQSPQVRVIECAHPEQEWQAAARWARKLIEAGSRSLCIVVPPGLSESAPEWRAFRDLLQRELDPGATVSMNDGSQAIHVPAASRLSQLPLVDDAMRLLRLAVGRESQPMAFTELSRCLLSPHWAGAESERLSRAALELRLREREIHSIGRDALCRLIRNERLDHGLGILLECLEGPPPPGAGSQVIRWFHSVLSHWGWPGQTEAAPVVKAFVAVLERLDRIEFESAAEALNTLGIVLEETQVPGGGGLLSPVQVLDPETAAAGQFDATWVCHLDDSAWPPAVQPNPFLPGAVRRGIPRLNPEGHLEYYTRLTEKLAVSAPQVRFSWSRDAGHGPRGPSALLDAWSHEAAKLETVPHEAGVFEYLQDETGLPLPPEDPLDLPGGTEFFRLQAACPLAAYTRFRLSGHFPEPPGPFASARYRGELLHHALRALYARGRGEQGIPMPTDIGHAIDEALGGSGARHKLSRAALAAERGRLQRALSHWLALDSTRPGFRVESLEIPQDLAMGRARFRLRIDRVDRLNDGRLFLIDYKSGGSRSRALKWMRERMQEPQLPVYAVMLDQALDEEIGGLAIGIVKPFECRFDGISDDEMSAAPGIRVAGTGRARNAIPDWRQAMVHWRTQALMLVGEILDAKATNIIYDADIFKYAGLDLVLRHEAVVEPDKEDNDDG